MTAGSASAGKAAPDFDGLLRAIGHERDRKAFAALFLHFAPRIKAYLMRAGTAANMAEELAQETMLTVWQKAASFDPDKAGASVWIFTIARNLRIDQIRREKSAAKYEPDPSDEPDLPPPSDAIVLASERENRVRKALKSLSEEQAKIVQMSFFSEKPHAEIARDLGIPLGTVKSRIRLAMDRLRNLLGDLT
ncbi:RNA polymerase sigma-70 factor (ECF subfamily) [Microvirga flocculans]|uniref:RNA polymerase sigma-70 factor (ECF subfamily) n=1 Tax=Microvirga flocculans TaxID=217168 RepID=A0A7W6IFG7_9HYPH|nr:sigma-70 family RNA polymerase sigma factor [Microvirga flocculans]MBB4040482.1 RNA polymerase sigma-70 factor (ECF subfamily) [Microvirga flocculans]